MLKKALSKCVGKHVKLRPIAKRFGGSLLGPELEVIDNDWVVERETEGGVFLKLHTGHVVDLLADHIHHFSTDPVRGDGYGFLTLTSQISIGGNDLKVEPIVGVPG